MAESKVEQMVKVKFNVSTAILMSPPEDLAWNAAEHNVPKKSIQYLNVSNGDVVEISKEVYEKIKNKIIRLPNGKRGDLRKASDMLTGFKASDTSQDLSEELPFCEKVAS